MICNFMILPFLFAGMAYYYHPGVMPPPGAVLLTDRQGLYAGPPLGFTPPPLPPGHILHPMVGISRTQLPSAVVPPPSGGMMNAGAIYAQPPPPVRSSMYQQPPPTLAYQTIALTPTAASSGPQLNPNPYLGHPVSVSQPAPAAVFVTSPPRGSVGGRTAYSMPTYTIPGGLYRGYPSAPAVIAAAGPSSYAGQRLVSATAYPPSVPVQVPMSSYPSMSLPPPPRGQPMVAGLQGPYLQRVPANYRPC